MITGLNKQLVQKTVFLKSKSLSPLCVTSNRNVYGKSRIGNRDVVGHGINGSNIYFDLMDYPFPAIRFREETPELTKLREKEKADWHKLTIDEKKRRT